MTHPSDALPQYTRFAECFFSTLEARCCDFVNHLIEFQTKTATHTFSDSNVFASYLRLQETDEHVSQFCGQIQIIQKVVVT